MNVRWLASAAVAAALLGASMGACNSPGTTSPPGAALSGVAPGHGSPGAAFAGWLDAVVGGENARACGYALPAQQTGCPAFLASQQTTLPGGAIRLGDTSIVGDRALIVPIGTVCINGSCRTNTDRRLGLPASKAGFQAAYQTALSTNVLTTGCQRVHGQWYLDLTGAVQPNAPI
ncbi:MAG: hypothetical protein E6G66_09520 [Actinobacteria bacterium]|nr:MAG: hypothetical protein E6G66_09520 [Actinomycetota bacterium]